MLALCPNELAVVILPRKEVAPPPPLQSSAADPITKWDNVKTQRLYALWQESDAEGPLHSLQEISEMLDVPAESVRHKAKSLGWSKRGRRRMAA
jgi:hypothetical protein